MGLYHAVRARNYLFAASKMSGTLAKINHETQNAFSGVFETHQELCEDNYATVGSTQHKTKELEALDL